MKLRNRHTRILGELHYEPDKEYHFTVVTKDSADMAIYRTLAELYGKWEDYIPKELLIKDKQTREEIKLFAYRNGIGCFRYQARNGALYNEADNGAVISLEVSDISEVEHLVDGCLYTIDELCGELES